jgi:hypothetical protein
LWSLLLLPVAGVLVPAIDVKILPVQQESAASGERGVAVPVAAVVAQPLPPDDTKPVVESRRSAGVLEQPPAVGTEPTMQAARTDVVSASSWS